MTTDTSMKYGDKYLTILLFLLILVPFLLGYFSAWLWYHKEKNSAWTICSQQTETEIYLLCMPGNTLGEKVNNAYKLLGDKGSSIN